MASIFRSLMLCTIYILLSSTLIQFNKRLMSPTRFPHAMVLTTLHMVTTCILCNLLYLVRPSMFPSMEKVKDQRRELFKSFVPLGLLFAIGLYGSNQAYLYCSAAFLQFMKEGNIVLVFTISCLAGMAVVTRDKVVNIIWIVGGASIAVVGEVHFVLLGFIFQVISQVGECCKNVMGEWLMKGRFKLDPLTYTMFMAPVCLVFLLIGTAVTWDKHTISDMKAMWPLLLPNACLAFLLNVSISVLIKEVSAMAFILSGLVKDVLIVAASAAVFGEQVVMNQYLGFMVCLSGVFFWSWSKIAPESQSAQLFRKMCGSAREPEKAPLIAQETKQTLPMTKDDVAERNASMTQLQDAKRV